MTVWDNIRTSDSWSGEFFRACANGNASSITSLVSRVSAEEINALVHGQTPLGIAVFHDSLLGVQELLARGDVDVNRICVEDSTALTLAAFYGRVSLIGPLLSAGANVGHRDQHGRSALLAAALRREEDTAIALLPACSKKVFQYAVTVEKGGEESTSVQPDPAQDSSSETEMDLTWRVAEVTCAFQLKRLFNALLEVTHIDPIADIFEKGSVLQCCVEHQRTEMLFILLKKGLSPDDRANSDDMTALMMCALTDGEHALPVAGMLLAQGAKVNKAESSGKTALFFAVEENNLELVEMLLNAGAWWDQIDEFNEQTPLHIACERGLVPIALLLVRYGARADIYADGYTCHGLSMLTSSRLLQDVMEMGMREGGIERGRRQCCAPGCIKVESEAHAYKRCAQCKRLVFCSRECQKKAWSAHRQVCAPPRSDGISNTRCP